MESFAKELAVTTAPIRVLKSLLKSLQKRNVDLTAHPASASLLQALVSRRFGIEFSKEVASQACVHPCIRVSSYVFIMTSVHAAEAAFPRFNCISPQVDLLNSADGDLKLKEMSLSVLAKLSLVDSNVDIVYGSLHKIESGYAFVWTVEVDLRRPSMVLCARFNERAARQ